VHHYHKDGAMRFFRNDSGNANAYYEPNSVGGPAQRPQYAEPPLPISGDADRYNHRDGNDDFTQAGNLFRLFHAGEQQRLFDNIAAAMQGVPESIQRRQIALFAQCDPAYGVGVARALKLDPASDDRLKGTSATDEPQKSAALAR
jgi:catalase